jgi:small subunit ribosomal protein S4e
MLDKLSGVFAPRPSTGPHKLRECLPLVILLRNRLKFALTKRECNLICMQRLVKVDHKVRTDITFPAGFMDVVTIDKIQNGNFRLLFNTKGRFVLQKITPQEAKYKLGKVRRCELGAKGVPYVALHDGRTIRYPHPDVKVNDTVKVDLETGKIETFVKFEVGNLCMITGGRNLGRVGVVVSREKHPGSFEIIHVKDAAGQSFATRISNVFIIGKGTKSLVSLPAKKGIKRTPLEELELARKSKETTTTAEPAKST